MNQTLWPEVPWDAVIFGMASIAVMQDPGNANKPVLKITFNGTTAYVTANLAEMIGGAAAGARKRWEDHQDG